MAGQDLMRGVQRSRTTWHARPGSGKNAALELAQFNGEIVYASGETALYAGIEVVDFGNDREPFEGSFMVVLRDGSTATQRIKGVVTARLDKQRVSGTGNWEIVSGHRSLRRSARRRNPDLVDGRRRLRGRLPGALMLPQPRRL